MLARADTGNHRVHAWIIENPKHTKGFLPVALAASGGQVDSSLDQEVRQHHHVC